MKNIYNTNPFMRKHFKLSRFNTLRAALLVAACLTITFISGRAAEVEKPDLKFGFIHTIGNRP